MSAQLRQRAPTGCLSAIAHRSPKGLALNRARVFSTVAAVVILSPHAGAQAPVLLFPSPSVELTISLAGASSVRLVETHSQGFTYGFDVDGEVGLGYLSGPWISSAITVPFRLAFFPNAGEGEEEPLSFAGPILSLSGEFFMSSWALGADAAAYLGGTSSGWAEWAWARPTVAMMGLRLTRLVDPMVFFSRVSVDATRIDGALRFLGGGEVAAQLAVNGSLAIILGISVRQVEPPAFTD